MFQDRGLLIYPEEAGPYWQRQLMGSGLNLIGIHPAGGPAAAQSLERLLEIVKTDRFLNFAHTLVDHGFRFTYEMHALSWLIPRSLLRENPDWFRMNEHAERVNDFNMCPANPEALAYLEQRCAHLVRQLPCSDKKYYFWLDDVKHTACQCDACRALSPSDQALILHNHMLRGARKAEPEAKMCYLAYLDTLPVPEKIKPDEGIFLEYAPIERNSAKPLGDLNCPENARQAMSIEALLAFFGRADSQVLEYWIDNSRFCNWRLPLKKLELDLAVLREDVRFYRKKGFEAVTSFACYLGEDYAALFGAPPLKAYADALGQQV